MICIHFAKLHILFLFHHSKQKKVRKSLEYYLDMPIYVKLPLHIFTATESESISSFVIPQPSYSEFIAVLQKNPNKSLRVFGIYCNFAEKSE